MNRTVGGEAPSGKEVAGAGKGVGGEVSGGIVGQRHCGHAAAAAVGVEGHCVGDGRELGIECHGAIGGERHGCGGCGQCCVGEPAAYVIPCRCRNIVDSEAAVEGIAVGVVGRIEN